MDANNVSDLTSQQEADFFGEPITFVFQSMDQGDIADIMARHDEYILSIISRGKAASANHRVDSGGDEGIEVKSAHAMAIVYSKFLEALVESRHRFHAPMLTCAAVIPLLVNSCLHYVKKVDGLLAATTSNNVSIKLLELAQDCVVKNSKIDEHLTEPELLYKDVLALLLDENKKNKEEALSKLMTILHRCPGDAFAMHCALELAYSLGGTQTSFSACRIAGSVASYWNERSRQFGSGILNSPGYYLGSSLIAVGLANGSSSSGSTLMAEGLSVAALSQDKVGCGALAAYALACSMEAEGRSSEGLSAVAGSDGGENIEGAGWLFFDSKLMGLAARFTLDRDGIRSTESALRYYDLAFQRVFEYHNRSLEKGALKVRKAPGNKRSGVRGFFQTINPFQSKSEEMDKSDDHKHLVQQPPENICAEDILTWLPPTPRLLSDATILLLWLTTDGCLKSSDEKWQMLRLAWRQLLLEGHSMDNHQGFDLYGDQISLKPIKDIPLAYACCSVLWKDEDRCHSNINSVLRDCGKILNLGEQNLNNHNESNSGLSEKFFHLAQSLYLVQSSVAGWGIDTRALFERLICVIALHSEDPRSVSVARAVCSESITTRSNSPEIWWRYSKVLDKLGDEEAAENARNRSISLGRGEGGGTGF